MKRTRTLWLLTTFSPQDGRWYRDYFDKEKTARAEWQDSLHHGWEPKSLERLVCMNICG